MKVGKEEIIGLVAAWTGFLRRTMRQWKRKYRSEPRWSQSAFKPFQRRSKNLRSSVANHVPHLLITYDRNRIKLTATEVMQRMREGNPRIELNPATGGGPPALVCREAAMRSSSEFGCCTG